MDQEQNEKLPTGFAKELCNIPVMPDQAFFNVQKTLHRKSLISRTIWLAAATLVLSVGLYRGLQPKLMEVSSSSEIIDELSSINTFYNEDERSTIADPDIETVLYQP